MDIQGQLVVSGLDDGESLMSGGEDDTKMQRL